jgi:hypothetical protein
MIAGLIAQHVPARADRCLRWFGGQIEGRRSIRSGGKPSKVSGAGPDGKASEAAKAGVPLTGAACPSWLGFCASDLVQVSFNKVNDAGCPVATMQAALGAGGFSWLVSVLLQDSIHVY